MSSNDTRQPKAHKLSPSELAAFLRRPNLARIATVNKDQRPHVVPVGFYYDGEYLVMFLRQFSESVQNIKQNPYVAVNIDCNATKAGDDGSRALVEGKAEFYEGDWHKLDEATNIKYFGTSSPVTEEERERKPRVCVRVKLSESRVTSWTGYDWHRRYKRDPVVN
jgi:nitroimidazol reductase NimA-like FMN-containing flavoprotein (pyridoxamine 5'-phosphate oxidase superfamily)